MTRSAFCVLTSLVLIILSFLHAFGVLAWYGDQFAADPARIGTITLAYPLIAWAVVRAVRSTDGDGLFGAFVMAVALGGMHLALEGWWSYSRGGMAIDEEYTAALPISGAVMIVLSVTLLSYCLAAHVGRKRRLVDALAVFLVAMSAFQGVSMFFIQLHAEHVYNEAASARLRAEIEQQLKDAQAALDESGRALQEIEDLTTGRPDHN
jgi:cell division protein FtsB